MRQEGGEAERPGVGRRREGVAARLDDQHDKLDPVLVGVVVVGKGGEDAVG